MHYHIKRDWRVSDSYSFYPHPIFPSIGSPLYCYISVIVTSTARENFTEALNQQQPLATSNNANKKWAKMNFAKLRKLSDDNINELNN